MKYQNAVSVGVLLSILIGGSVIFWRAAGNTGLQLTIGVMITVTYILWGILHHAQAGPVHRKVVIEYVLVGFVALVLLATLAL